MLKQTITAIQPLNQEVMTAAQTRQIQLTKPEGSLGRLESLSIQLAGITGRLDPPLTNRAIIVAAGDHGVAAEGVSAYPPAVTPQMVLSKVAVIQKAIELNRPDPSDPLDVLAKVGGFEMGAIAGIILGAAARRIPVLVDGFISTAGALIAVALAPNSRHYIIAAHRSVEPGHRVMQQHLDLQPIFQLDLRLGEGTGAALAMPVVAAAAAILNEMATFADAGVSGKE